MKLKLKFTLTGLFSAFLTVNGQADPILTKLEQGIFLSEVVDPGLKLWNAVGKIEDEDTKEKLKYGSRLISGMSQSDTLGKYRFMRMIKKYLVSNRVPSETNRAAMLARENTEGLLALQNLPQMEDIPGLNDDSRAKLSDWANQTLSDLESMDLPNNVKLKLDRNPVIPEDVLIYRLIPQYSTQGQVALGQRMRVASSLGIVMQLFGDFVVTTEEGGREILDEYARHSSREEYLEYLDALSVEEFRSSAIPSIEKRLLALNMRGLREDQFMVEVLGSVQKDDEIELEFVTYGKSNLLDYSNAKKSIINNFESRGLIYGLKLISE